MEFRFGKAGWLALLAFGAVLAVCLFAGCAKEAQEQTEAVTEETEVTVPAPTAPANGNPGDITCRGSYTAEAAEAEAAADMTVAVMGDKALTNGQLQIYYWLEVAAYRQAGHEIAPDFDAPLDTQLCPIDETAVTWQQYFLQRALNTWRSSQALMQQSREWVILTEEAYQPDAEDHAEHLADAPATKYLYGYNEHYQVNELHQAYLDSLPELLGSLAAENGLADTDALARAIAGPGADGEALEAFARLYNEAYMYYTYRSYEMTPAEEDVEAYFAAREADYREAGITRDSGYYVTVRHILLVPENAQTAQDGTVTCEDKSWEKCERAAAELLRSFGSKGTEAEFGQLAYENSADAGSSGSGGLYAQLREGQLIPALDAWCFDPERQAGDTEIIRTEYGCHILYFSGRQEIWYAEAEAGLLAMLSDNLITDAVETHSHSIAYSNIKLGTPESADMEITADTLLYPDVAHERYPSVPLYLQQDYPGAKYGSYKLSSHGCGICSLAMVASYILDEEVSPVTLGEQYGKYCHKTGSDTKLLVNVPKELGFYIDKRCYKWAEVTEALESGEVVFCLQVKGHFTTSGHYVVLEKLTEDGLVVVRDSSIKNYGKLEGHSVDAFEVPRVTAAGVFYWAVQEKVTRIPTCVRCGEPESEGVCAGIFTEDYCCQKCRTALLRRENFLTLCGGVEPENT